MKTPLHVKRTMYPLYSKGDWGSGKDKSISEWLKEKGYDLLKVRALDIFHLDMRCSEQAAIRLFRTYLKPEYLIKKL